MIPLNYLHMWHMVMIFVLMSLPANSKGYVDSRLIFFFSLSSWVVFSWFFFLVILIVCQTFVSFYFVECWVFLHFYKCSWPFFWDRLFENNLIFSVRLLRFYRWDQQVFNLIFHSWEDIILYHLSCCLPVQLLCWFVFKILSLSTLFIPNVGLRLITQRARVACFFG